MCSSPSTNECDQQRGRRANPDESINHPDNQAHEEAAGAGLLFLPKYSPDLDPIERLFAKLKGYVRKTAPRTLDALSDAIAQALTMIPQHECANYLISAGYASA